MERHALMGPFDLHLQWFADPQPAPAGNPPAGPAPQPAPAPAPELKADGTFFAQASDKYKKDPKYLQDILGGEKPLKSWDGVLDRMYAAEAHAKELEGQLPVIPEKPEEYEFEELKFPDFLAADEFKDLRDQVAAYLKGYDDSLRTAKLTKDGAKAESTRFRQAVFAQYKAAQDAFNEAREKGLQALKESWKGDFQANEELAKRAVLTFGGEELVKVFSELHLENHPLLIQAFHKIGKAIGEGELVPGTAGKTQLSEEEKKKAAMQARYNRSPELTGAQPTPASQLDQARMDRLSKRFPKQAAEKKE